MPQLDGTFMDIFRFVWIWIKYGMFELDIMYYFLASLVIFCLVCLVLFAIKRGFEL